jgi:cytosine/uracil/thiamine/allantoin permease
MEDNKPIAIIAAVALGIPLLIFLVLFAGNSGINDGLGTAVSLVFVLGTFLSAFIFEIKRIADLPPVGEEHGH